MTCLTSSNGEKLYLCPNMLALLHASAVVGSEGLLIYDRLQKSFIETKIFSPTILAELAGRDLRTVMEENNIYHILDISKTNIWEYAENPYNGQLSLNVCLNSKRSFYVNLQITPINWGNSSIRYLLCSLHFAVKQEFHIVFFDRGEGSIWRYEINPKTFIKESRHLPSGKTLEMLRLARMGYSERLCAQLLYVSFETIKSYRKSLYKSLDVSSIEEAISYCTLHHLI